MTSSTSGAAGAAQPIVVNGTATSSRATSVSELLAELGLDAARVATARNGEFVPAAARATTAIVAGDHIEVVSARQGG